MAIIRLVPITTAAQLELMTPRERHEHFQASVVTSLDRVPSDFLERVRGQLTRKIDRREI